MTQLQAHRGPTRRSARGAVSGVVAGTVLVAALAAGCSGSGGGGGSSSAAKAPGRSSAAFSGSDQQAQVAKPLDAAGGAAAPDAGSGGSAASAASAALLQQRRLVLTSDVDVTVADVFRAAARVRTMASAAGGYVGDEKTSGTGRTAESALTLRVPQDKLGLLTDQVVALGKVVSRGQNSQDVTQQTIDVTSRLASQKASVARIRALLAQATKISDIVAIEGELSRRESDLESMEAQLKGLNDSVDLATLSVVLSPQGAPAPVKATSGFGAGLQHGWDAFVGALVVLLTVLGAVLPFALTLAIVGIPAYLVWRRRRTGPAPTTTPLPEA